MSCIWCGGIIKKNASKYCSRSCKPQYNYHIWLNKWKLGLDSGHKKSDYKPSYYLIKYLWDKYDGKCSRCGWDTPNPYINKVILEVEHIDGDCSNNREENLDLICPNCHSLTPTFRALNKGNSKRPSNIFYNGIGRVKI